MGQDSKIEWTQHTFNPWRGCTKVSEGCRNCYAETLSGRNPGTLGVWGPQGTRVVAAEAAWKEPLKWDRLAKKAGERHRVFCASLADVFEDWKGPMVDHKGTVLIERFSERPFTMNDARKDLFTLIDRTPNLDWLLLTKRPENIMRMWPRHIDGGDNQMLWSMELGEQDNGRGSLPREIRNVWIGASVENQQAADERIPHLLQTPAKVRFLSCEPLLGEVNLRQWVCSICARNPQICSRHFDAANGIHWCIVGGESGHNSRPMHPDWARSLRDQCQAANVAYFFKQWGEYGPGSVNTTTNEPVFRKFTSHEQWVTKASTWINGGICLDATGKLLSNGKDFAEAKYPVTIMHKVGKKDAGRLLDGKEHSEFPEVV